ncbi:MAG TPA: fused MFS/spermidine synthase [Candidatus Paceibacterota bacterium]|nr:fused MFS/spermidine synthase [Verrucomicrobiota bacterium]HSA12618.1 fused MFS/spermidine synthase [Candidatus Paceibacterota bacterium]
MKKKAAPALEPALSRPLRRYLYFTAAVTGAAIMIVEILGAKMLSPFVGLSHFVWTAQIAVTLVALASGYYAGGRLADRSQRLARLYWAILGAAIYLVLTVRLCEPVAYWGLDFNLAVGSLLASAILFFVPLALLAMTGPYLVRVITSSVAGVGGNVGRLTSIGTLGSLGGTLLIGYLLIPLLPNSLTMYFTALALMLVCAGYFLFARRVGAAAVILLLGLGLAIGGRGYLAPAHSYAHATELFRGNSHFGLLQVVDARGANYRLYLNDSLVQNTYDPERKLSVSHFTYALSGLARAYTTNIADALCIGLGVGIVPMEFARQGARVDVVEINPAVVPVAVRFFDLQTNQIHLTLDDGRHFLNRCRKHYDTVILDAFLGDSSPSHLFTRQAFAAIRRVLRPGGTLVINSFGSLEAGRDFFAASLNNTLKAVFPSVRAHATGDGAIFFVAGNRSDLALVHAPDLSNVHPYVLREAEATYASLVDPSPERGRVLTDDFNPAEFYDARNREDFRRKLALAAKEM